MSVDGVSLYTTTAMNKHCLLLPSVLSINGTGVQIQAENIRTLCTQTYYINITQGSQWQTHKNTHAYKTKHTHTVKLIERRIKCNYMPAFASVVCKNKHE